jgi:hypothetical protein
MMSNFSSLLFYFILLSLSALLMKYGLKIKSRAYIYLSLIIPITIGSFRYNVGTDYGTYSSIYQEMSHLSYYQFFNSVQPIHEVGFFTIIKISQWLSNGPQLMFALSSLLTIGFIYLALNRYKLKHTALIYFLYLFMIFPTTLNAARQCIALSISFYAISYISEKKLIKYIFWLVVAALFHTSALILLPIYFVPRIFNPDNRQKISKYLIRLGIFSLLLLTLLPIIIKLILSISLFSNYVKYETLVSVSSNNTFYLYLLIYLILLVFIKNYIYINKNNYIYILIYIYTYNNFL